MKSHSSFLLPRKTTTRIAATAAAISAIQSAMCDVSPVFAVVVCVDVLTGGVGVLPVLGVGVFTVGVGVLAVGVGVFTVGVGVFGVGVGVSGGVTYVFVSVATARLS